MEERASLQYDQRCVAAVAERLDLRLVVLFGSRAGGKLPPRPYSDVDVAVLDGFGEKQTDYLTCYRALAPLFKDASLDLVMLCQADPLLRYEVMRNGVCLYGEPDAFLEYRCFAFRDFVDSSDLRALEEALFVKKMRFLEAHLDAASGIRQTQAPSYRRRPGSTCRVQT